MCTILLSNVFSWAMCVCVSVRICAYVYIWIWVCAYKCVKVCVYVCSVLLWRQTSFPEFPGCVPVHFSVCEVGFFRVRLQPAVTSDKHTIRMIILMVSINKATGMMNKTEPSVLTESLSGPRVEKSRKDVTFKTALQSGSRQTTALTSRARWSVYTHQGC